MVIQMTRIVVCNQEVLSAIDIFEQKEELYIRTCFFLGCVTQLLAGTYVGLLCSLHVLNRSPLHNFCYLQYTEEFLNTRILSEVFPG